MCSYALGLFTTASLLAGDLQPGHDPSLDRPVCSLPPALLLYRQQPVVLTRAHIAGLANASSMGGADNLLVGGAA